MSGNTISLQWDEYHRRANKTFKDLLSDNNFTDVTLACADSKQISAHKVILSSASEFFERLFLNNPRKEILVYLKGISFRNLELMTKFIYLGEVEVSEENLQSFLDSAKELEIKGLNTNDLTHDAPMNLEIDETSENETIIDDSHDEFTHFLSSEGVKEERKERDEGEIDTEFSQKLSINIEEFSDEIITIADEEVSVDGVSSSEVSDGKDKKVPKAVQLATEFSFDTKPFVTRNTKSEGLNTLKCKECLQKFASAGALINHRRSKHEGISYSCDFCDYKNGQAGNLRKHVVKHHSK